MEMKEVLDVGPNYQLDSDERAHLYAITSQPGFAVLNKIIGSIFIRFQERIILCEEDKAVLEAQRLARAAAQYYKTIRERVNNELLQYTHTPQQSDIPQDVTEGVLDLGEIVKATEDLPNFFGDVVLEENNGNS